MYCPNCGVFMPDGQTLCDNCAKLYQQATNSRADANTFQQSQNAAGSQAQGGKYTPHNMNYPPHNNVYSAPQDKPQRQPLTIGQWLIRYLIFFIPLVGPVAYLVMLFIWANDKTKEESAATWAKTQLIFLAVAVGGIILLYALLLVIGVITGQVFNSINYYYSI